MTLNRKTGYSPLNAENNRGVTNDLVFAYLHEKKKTFCFLLWAFLFFFFFMILTWTHKVLYTTKLLSINWASIETCKFSRNSMYAYLLYIFIYIHAQVFFLYRNKSYIFPMLWLAKIEYWAQLKLTMSLVNVC